MYKNMLCGVKTSHNNGAVHRTDHARGYLLMCFRTPFFYIIDGERMMGGAGDCLCYRPGETVIHGSVDENKTFVNDWIYFSTDRFEYDNFPFGKLLHTENENLLAHDIKTVINECSLNDEFSEKIISDSIQKMLISLIRVATASKNTEHPMYEQFRKARDHVLLNYGERWTLDKMAILTGYSTSRFCSIYSELFGKSPINDLLEHRIERAKRFLELDIYGVEEIAELCGFASVHYFSRFFKNSVGETPTEYRRRGSEQ